MINNKKNSFQVTRGSGILELYLSKQRSKLANKLIPASAREGRILDIGCGTYPYFLTQTKFQEKFGIDKNALDVTQHQNMKIYKQGFEESFSIFSDNSFAIITLLAVFEHFEPKNIAAVLKEIKRLLGTGGRFILTTPCPWADPLLKLMAKIKLASPEEINDHKRSYNHLQLRNYLVQAGFDPQKIKNGYFECYLNSWMFADK